MSFRTRLIVAGLIMAVGFIVANFLPAPQDECVHRLRSQGKPVGGLACDQSAAFPAGKQIIPLAIALPVALGFLMISPRLLGDGALERE